MTISEMEESQVVRAVCHDLPNAPGYEEITPSAWPPEANLYQQLGLADIQIKEELALQALNSVERKQQGVFFTPTELSKLSVEKFGYSIEDGAILDPACGTGNLLLALAESFDASLSLEATLTEWNSKLYGIDINHNFVEVARKKLIKLALDKGAIPSGEKSPTEILALLSNIRVGDFLKEHKEFKGVVGSVIMNPPFCHIDASDDIEWTSGRFNAAALFVFHAVAILSDGGRFLGILPDVLRSGTRYSQWRTQLFGVSDCTIETFGNFQRGVQVDVFILQGVKTHAPGEVAIGCLVEPSIAAEILMDRFEVSVGPVVPHRDRAEGIEAPFAHAKILPVWKTVDSLPERICHSGRKFLPPFVAVRRTSSPKDRYRAAGTIVNCTEPVAVENHIIVLSPKDRTLRSCQSLLEFLKSDFVNDHINSEIRCRHLTVGVMKGIPIGGMADGD
ncbi:TPA: N-6 DNA methylase [Pseudomonas aeruginosa]|nr:N-6 DNA methylase [Pseudomonas aeruginosa]